MPPTVGSRAPTHAGLVLPCLPRGMLAPSGAALLERAPGSRVTHSGGHIFRHLVPACPQPVRLTLCRPSTLYMLIAPFRFLTVIRMPCQGDAVCTSMPWMLAVPGQLRARVGPA
jgi:hypothetical protein